MVACIEMFKKTKTVERLKKKLFNFTKINKTYLNLIKAGEPDIKPEELKRLSKDSEGIYNQIKFNLFLS